jgi:hypothetical protein
MNYIISYSSMTELHNEAVIIIERMKAHVSC